MLTHLEPAAPARPFLTWQRYLFLLVAVLLLTAVLLIRHDAALEPWDDLDPRLPPVPDATTNGYLLLKERFAALPELDDSQKQSTKTLLSGESPWDSASVADLLKGRETLADSLRDALALPEWYPPVPLTADQIGDDLPGWIIQPSRLLMLQAKAAIHAGDFATALDHIRLLHQWSLRQLSGSRNLIHGLLGIALLQNTAGLTCDFLAAKSPGEAEWASLLSLWQDPPISKQDVQRWLKAEVPFFAAALDADGPLTISYFPEKSVPAFGRALVKRNRTLNRYHRIMRVIVNSALDPAPSLEASGAAKAATLSRPERGLSRLLNPNFYGDALIEADQSFGLPAMHKALYRPLFVQRALRVRLALGQWQQTHHGTLPKQLAELVPDFLTEIPHDPWNAAPLAWNPVTATIYAVGTDWTPDLPTFRSPSGTTAPGWFSPDPASPGLRLHLPVPAPPVPSPPEEDGDC